MFKVASSRRATKSKTKSVCNIAEWRVYAGRIP